MSLPSMLQPVHPGYVWRFKPEHAALQPRLVPTDGAAATLQGELIRAVDKLWYEGMDNGNVNWGPDFDWFTDLLDWNLVGGAGGAARPPQQPAVPVAWLDGRDAAMAVQDIAIIRHCGRIGFRNKPGFARQSWYGAYLAAHPEVAAEPDGPDEMPDVAYAHSDVYEHLMDCVMVWCRQHQDALPYRAPDWLVH